MKRKLILPALLLPLLLAAACFDEASIRVTNKVHNVMLDNIQFDQIGIASGLLTGETTSKLTISEHTAGVNFPITAQVQFYMVQGDRRVFLKTEDVYTLDVDDNLTIVIDDSTAVVNSFSK
ncbi:MAG: hypothetical protein LBO71_03890 [Prevotellaceae bacterium]|jgi:hypothetical protein|nr:hypothetical protein [Prevotellaceae bacterium]